MMVFQLRSNRDLLTLIPAAEKTIHGLAPQLPIFQVQTMRQSLYTTQGLLLFQIGASLAAIMGGLGLTLAVIGLYGVFRTRWAGASTRSACALRSAQAEARCSG